MYNSTFSQYLFITKRAGNTIDCRLFTYYVSRSLHHYQFIKLLWMQVLVGQFLQFLCIYGADGV